MEFKLDYAGLGLYLNSSPELQEALNKTASAGADKIRPYAPVGPPSDPHRGDYQRSLRGEEGKGAKADRLGSRIVAAVDWAAAHEFGNAEQGEGKRFLGTTGLEILTSEAEI